MNRKIFLALALAVALIFFLLLALRLFSQPPPQGEKRPSSGPVISFGRESSLLESARKASSTGDAEKAIKDYGVFIAGYAESPKAEAAYFELADLYDKRGDPLKARVVYQNFLEMRPSSENIQKAQESLENLNVKILFSSIDTPDSFLYEVKKGDTLNKIARENKTTVELIKKSNNIKTDAIRAGIKLKITRNVFSVVIDKSQNVLTLKSGDEIFKTYRVSTGKDSSPTPAGVFIIANKIIDPPWYPPAGGVIPSHDPRNVLGSRWLGLSKPKYGIHGTIEPQSIGKSITDGCVRLANPDVEELYAIVPEGIEVVITD